MGFGSSLGGSWACEGGALPPLVPLLPPPAAGAAGPARPGPAAAEASGRRCRRGGRGDGGHRELSPAACRTGAAVPTALPRPAAPRLLPVLPPTSQREAGSPPRCGRTGVLPAHRGLPTRMTPPGGLLALPAPQRAPSAGKAAFPRGPTQRTGCAGGRARQPQTGRPAGSPLAPPPSEARGTPPRSRSFARTGGPGWVCSPAPVLVETRPAPEAERIKSQRADRLLLGRASPRGGGAESHGMKD